MIEFNFEECKNVSGVKNKVRADMSNLLFEFLKSTFGEENVNIVGANEVAVAVGTYPDSDGFSQEVCCVVKTIAKPFLFSNGEKRDVVPYDRIQEAENYQIEVKSKQK